LAGPPSNSTGVGAVIRLIYRESRGPAREVHAGAGYWSQDSAVQVMGKSEAPSGLWVRWPGGRTTEYDLPAGALEVRVGPDGRIEAIDPRK
jgi:hypothetical protein